MRGSILRSALFALFLALAALGAAQSVMKGQAFVLRQDADFWTLKDGKMTWVEKIALGTVVDLFKNTEKGTYKGTEYVLAKVKTESGTEGYIIDSLLAREAIMGAVVSDLATLYSQPRDASILSTVLPVANLVGLWPVEGKPDFYKVAAYVNNTPYRDKYILASDVTVRSQDINALLLLKAAEGMPKKEQKQKILKTIDAKYPGTVFADLVAKLRNEVEPAPAATANTAPAETIALGGVYSVSKPLNVRDKPSAEGAILQVIAEGESVEVRERTSETAIIGGLTDYWYRIATPVDGWVFGAYLVREGQ
jgi:hypothetical protein